ncbi:MAG TPA: hypothetical protein VIC26_04285 [Marinagarivorans sp.]
MPDQTPLKQLTLSGLLQCPNCKDRQALDLKTLLCSNCNTQYFHLDGNIPCLFPAGEHHKALWQHQAAIMQSQGQQGLAHVEEALSRYDLTPTTHARLSDTYHALSASQATVLRLLAEAGIQPARQKGIGNAGNLSEYYEIMLRDWGWPGEENPNALAQALACLPNNIKAQRILVLGAGAARLSWDLHCALQPNCTIALDSNPVLLILANALIRKRQPIELAEFKVFPQAGKEFTRSWPLQPPAENSALADSWYALGANAWSAPLEPNSFDLIVTPWFIDVNGGDVRDTIGVVSRLLAPEGRWLNTGPLLFPRHLPIDQKYQHTEIREFLDLAGFTLEAESLTQAAHLDSPLEVRKQQEQLWTFCALGPEQTPASSLTQGKQPPWLVMHHLPVTQHAYISQQKHPLIDAILSLIDGERSINDIAAHIAPHMPETMSPKDAVVTLLGQILHEITEAPKR